MMHIILLVVIWIKYFNDPDETGTLDIEILINPQLNKGH